MAENVITRSRHFVNGDWQECQERLILKGGSERDHETTVDLASEEQVGEAVRCASDALRSWRRMAAHSRASSLLNLRDIIADRGREFARQMTADTGKTIRESHIEVERSISTLTISAEEAKRIAGEVVPMEAVAGGAGKLGFTIRLPVGVVAAITPFNAPMNMICHKVGPALAAGNTIVVKPHPRGAGTATLFAECVASSDLPPGVFNLVHGEAAVGRSLTTHREVAFVNFTGSGPVAEKILSQIGVKPSLLELGGNAPTIVHRDADLDAAVQASTEAAFGLSGQSCISTQRLLVHSSVYDEFLEELTTRARAWKADDPWKPETLLGPMLDEESARRVESLIQQAVTAGAVLRCGGERRGAFLDATVLTDMSPEDQVVCEEVFGPVVTVATYDDLPEAIESANSTPWGLKAGVFTRSLAVAMQCARELEFGAVNINAASRARVDQEPSGGTKYSGWGKEGPRYAIREMTVERMISLAMPK